jgi:hypothetical protein
MRSPRSAHVLLEPCFAARDVVRLLEGVPFEEQPDEIAPRLSAHDGIGRDVVLDLAIEALGVGGPSETMRIRLGGESPSVGALDAGRRRVGVADELVDRARIVCERGIATNAIEAPDPQHEREQEASTHGQALDMISRVLVRRSSIILLLALTGCARACKNDHPYVPSATDPSASASSLAASEPPKLDAGAAADSVIAPPPGTTSLEIDGAQVSMSDREIVQALVADFDGDGKKDVLAIVRPAGDAGPPSTGELVHWRGGVPAPAVVASGPTMSVDPSCAPSWRLARIGPRSAFAELGTACSKGTGTRALYVVRIGPAIGIAFDAIVTDPPLAPKLGIEAIAEDRDKDGNDDTVLAVTLEAEGKPKVTAKLAFFDRPAGPSRDAEEPAASLDALAKQIAKQAGKSKEAANVPPMVEQMRALYRAVCLDGGAPRIEKVHGGSAPSCGTSKALEDAGVAAVRAYVTLGDAIHAFNAADVASVAPATRTAARITEMHKALADVAPPLDARSSRSLNVLVDAPRGQHPEWGALAFESQKLLVRHGDKVSRVDLTTWEQEESDVPAWPSRVVSPDGKMRWLEAYHACEGVALRATFAPVAEGDVHDVVLPIVPRLGAKCSGGRGEASSAVPVAWTARGLEAIVAGEPVAIRLDAPNASALASFSEDPPPKGSPRSPGGKAIAIATPQGLLVKTADRTTLRRAPDFMPYASLRHCTTTDDGAAVACQKSGHVVVAFY